MNKSRLEEFINYYDANKGYGRKWVPYFFAARTEEMERLVEFKNGLLDGGCLTGTEQARLKGILQTVLAKKEEFGNTLTYDIFKDILEEVNDAAAYKILNKARVAV